MRVVRFVLSVNTYSLSLPLRWSRRVQVQVLFNFAGVTCFRPKARGPRGKVRVKARGRAVVLASSKHASSNMPRPPSCIPHFTSTTYVPHGLRLLLPCLGSEKHNGRGRCHRSMSRCIFVRDPLFGSFGFFSPFLIYGRPKRGGAGRVCASVCKSLF